MPFLERQYSVCYNMGMITYRFPLFCRVLLSGKRINVSINRNN